MSCISLDTFSDHANFCEPLLDRYVLAGVLVSPLSFATYRTNLCISALLRFFHASLETTRSSDHQLTCVQLSHQRTLQRSPEEKATSFHVFELLTLTFCGSHIQVDSFPSQHKFVASVQQLLLEIVEVPLYGRLNPRTLHDFYGNVQAGCRS